MQPTSALHPLDEPDDDHWQALAYERQRARLTEEDARWWAAVVDDLAQSRAHQLYAILLANARVVRVDRQARTVTALYLDQSVQRAWLSFECIDAMTRAAAELGVKLTVSILPREAFEQMGAA